MKQSALFKSLRELALGQPKVAPRKNSDLLNRSRNRKPAKSYSEARQYALTQSLCQYASPR